MMPYLDAKRLVSRHKGLYPFVLLPQEVEDRWEVLEPHIEASVRYSRGMVTVNGIRQALAEAAAVCIGTAIDHEPQSIMVCRPVYYDTYIATRIIAAGGKGLGEAMTFFHILEEYAISIGATEVESWCRPAVARLLRKYGWRSQFEMLTFPVRRQLQ